MRPHLSLGSPKGCIVLQNLVRGKEDRDEAYSMNFHKVCTSILACLTIRLSPSLKATAFLAICASSHSKDRFLLEKHFISELD